MTSWLDLCNLQDFLEVMRDKVADSETDIFEGSIIDQIFQNSPKLSNLAFLSNIRRVNQEEVGSGSESINGFLNGFLDGFEFGGQIYPLAAPNARMAETVTDLASFPILGRNMVYRRCEVTLSSALRIKSSRGTYLW